MLIVVAFVVAALAGCATWPYTQMTPDQITASAKIKDASVTCVRAVYAGAVITTVSVMADKAVPAGIKIKDTCETEFLSSTNTDVLVQTGRELGRAEGQSAGIAEAEALEQKIAERVDRAVKEERASHDLEQGRSQGLK